MNNKTVLLIHGGAGVITKSKISEEREKQFLKSLNDILVSGNEILKNGGTALDAVTEAVRLLENDELYNAGKGSVFTEKGINEMDAGIMDGSTLKCGAVAGVTKIKNPIIAARNVMEKTKHILLIGKGAEEFAELNQLEIVEPSYFFTQNRYDQLMKAKSKNQVILDHDGENLINKDQGLTINLSNDPIHPDSKMGTVGAVALDKFGNLAAATSTGGMTNKMNGRVGDTPIIGAGVYANHIVAVSGTGTGEAFIRTLASYDISALMEYGGLSLEEASNKVVMDKLINQGKGDGGIIAVDASGNFSLCFNSEGMYRGYAINENGLDKIVTGIYKENNK